MIRSGRISELCKDSGQWVFADLGFSEKNKTCGLPVHEKEEKEITFGDLLREMQVIITSGHKTINILLEAPLSVAFNNEGNPTGRKIEEHPNGNDKQPRYWYLGLGCGVMVAATYLLRSVFDAESTAEIRLFEGFASFKSKGAKSSHVKDVKGLRDVAWGMSKYGNIIEPEQLRRCPQDRLESAFKVAGMDFGVPPVVVLPNEKSRFST
jgi:hypothetical protein